MPTPCSPWCRTWAEHRPSEVHARPERWLTREVAPTIARKGGSIGYSFLAEAYLNFGPVGACLVLFLLGAAVVRLDRWATGEPGAPRAARIVAAASLFPFLLVFPRAEATTVVRGLAWYSVAPYLLILVFQQM